MQSKFTKKYLKWFYEIRVARIKYNENLTNENKSSLEELQSVKWTKRTKYKGLYIKSGGLTKSAEQLNLFNSQLEHFYAKLL